MTIAAPARPADYWLRVCRAHVRDNTSEKTAELGGDGNNQSFTQAFSNLAHAFVRDRAPSLLDHEIGFQLLDRNQENTKAIGIFGFKVGSQHIYAPVFFLKGELKGHELLYLKDQDLFVPMKENWLQYLLNRKPNIIGAGVNRQEANRGITHPDLQRLRQSPYKLASSLSNLKGLKAQTVEWLRQQQAAGAAPTDEQIVKFDNDAQYTTLREKLPYIAAPLAAAGTLGGGLAGYALGKWASWVIPEVQPFLPKMASLINEEDFETELDAARQHFDTRLNLLTFLKTASLPARQACVSWLQTYPWLADAVDQMHGMDKVGAALREGAAYCRTASVLDAPVSKYRAETHTGSVLDEQERQKSAAAKQKLKVIYFDVATTDGLPDELTDEDREALVRDRVLIQDGRNDDEVAVPYNIQVEQKLFNPGESGLYLVLVKPGKFEKCYIGVHPHGPDGRERFATVVRIGDEANWANLYAGNVWCAAQIEDEEYTDWYGGLSDADSLSSGDAFHVAVGPRGDASVPFRVESSLGDSSTDKAYNVEFASHCLDRQPGRSGLKNDGGREYSGDYIRCRDGQRVRLEKRVGTRLRSVLGDLFIPARYKLLTAKAGAEATKEEEADCRCPAPPPDKTKPVGRPPGCDDNAKVPTHSEPRPIQPGNFVDAQMLIMTKTSELKVSSDRHEYRLGASRPMSKIAALVHLVREHGLREDTARELLAQADTQRVIRPRIKYAAPGGQDPNLTGGGPYAPTFPEPQMDGYNPMGFQGNTMSDQGPQSLPVEDMSSRNTDPNAYNPNPENTPSPYDMGAMQGAAQSGQKEVLDTSMISSLLRTVRDDSTDKWIPDLVTGLDRLGRILFTFYWSADRFAERYGKQEMPELEDSLRNTFENLGDVVLFLKQKTVEAYPEESTRALDMGPTSDA